MADMALTARNI